MSWGRPLPYSYVPLTPRSSLHTGHIVLPPLRQINDGEGHKRIPAENSLPSIREALGNNDAFEDSRASNFAPSHFYFTKQRDAASSSKTRYLTLKAGGTNSSTPGTAANCQALIQTNTYLLDNSCMSAQGSKNVLLQSHAINTSSMPAVELAMSSITSLHNPPEYRCDMPTSSNSNDSSKGFCHSYELPSHHRSAFHATPCPLTRSGHYLSVDIKGGPASKSARTKVVEGTLLGEKSHPSLFQHEIKSQDSIAAGVSKNRRKKSITHCHSCNRIETPEWRRGPNGARTLCNACGLHYAKLSRRMRERMTSV